MTKYPYHIITRVHTVRFGLTQHLAPLRLWLTEHIGKPYEDWITLGDEEKERVVVFCRTEEQALLISLRWL